MTIGTLNLTTDGVYVTYEGKLPERQPYDKTLLRGLVSIATISEEGKALLPPSMPPKAIGKHDMAITIKEIANCDLLIISRSQEECKGHVFRLDNFKRLVKMFFLEIWIKDIHENN